MAEYIKMFKKVSLKKKFFLKLNFFSLFNKLLICSMFLTIIVFIFGCDKKNVENGQQNKKLNVVVTIFPIYDFVKQIAADKINLKMLMLPGVDSHSFEPTPNDISIIENADVLIYIGGSHDMWIDKILNVLNTPTKNKIKVLKLIECLNKNDEFVDYHVWTSLNNCVKMIKTIQSKLSELDFNNADFYLQNSNSYSLQLTNLKKEFENLIQNSSRNTIVFADKFPFKHFTDEFHLNFKTPFPNCSAKTETSAIDVAELIDFVKLNKIPIILKTDYTNSNIADIVSNETGAKIKVLFSCHTISKTDFLNGKTYLNFMEENLKTLKEALN